MDSLMHAFRYLISFRMPDVTGWSLSGTYRCISSNNFCCLSGFLAKWCRALATEKAVCNRTRRLVCSWIFHSKVSCNIETLNILCYFMQLITHYFPKQITWFSYNIETEGFTMGSIAIGNLCLRTGGSCNCLRLMFFGEVRYSWCWLFKVCYSN